MNTNQVIPNVYGPSKAGTVVRETTTVEKEFDSKGRVTKETTITEKETYIDGATPTPYYAPTWPETFTNGVKYGSSDTLNVE